MIISKCIVSQTLALVVFFKGKPLRGQGQLVQIWHLRLCNTGIAGRWLVVLLAQYRKTWDRRYILGQGILPRYRQAAAPWFVMV